MQKVFFSFENKRLFRCQPGREKFVCKDWMNQYNASFNSHGNDGERKKAVSLSVENFQARAPKYSNLRQKAIVCTLHLKLHELHHQMDHHYNALIFIQEKIDETNE